MDSELIKSFKIITNKLPDMVSILKDIDNEELEGIVLSILGRTLWLMDEIEAIKIKGRGVNVSN